MKKSLAQDVLADNRNTYNLIAEKFSNTRNRQWPTIERLAEKYVTAKNKILDVGCGNGRLYDLLQGKDVDYLGIDSSDNLIKLAGATGGRFIVKDILDLDFGQEFDVVFAIAVINHLPNKDLRLKTLGNIFAALKKDGYLIMTNWNLWRLSIRQKTVWKYLLRGKAKKQKGSFRDVVTYFHDQDSEYPLYYYAFTLYELKKLVRRAGFKVVEAYYEKNGKKSWWGAGNNLVLVCQK
ncbi:MAG: methyltransferase domain-containing protein [Patescibacteria group bacterium]|jgi:SAM-dependent methyltransferase